MKCQSCEPRDRRDRKEEQDMRSSRLLLAVLASIFLLSTASTPAQSAHASSPSAKADAPRSFYLTKGRFNGGKALTACATGYHMASIWEIKDTTLLQYNNSLGRTDGDSTFGGPPSSTTTDSTGIGWIRTGSSLLSCKKWTSSSAGDTGTEGTLSINGTGQPVWVVGDGGNCNATASGTHQGVWCVQN
jgi:hypothetical protein